MPSNIDGERKEQPGPIHKVQYKQRPQADVLLLVKCFLIRATRQDRKKIVHATCKTGKPVAIKKLEKEQLPEGPIVVGPASS